VTVDFIICNHKGKGHLIKGTKALRSVTLALKLLLLLLLKEVGAPGLENRD
jgi:hypothetical protein